MGAGSSLGGTLRRQATGARVETREDRVRGKGGDFIEVQCLVSDPYKFTSLVQNLGRGWDKWRLGLSVHVHGELCLRNAPQAHESGFPPSTPKAPMRQNPCCSDVSAPHKNPWPPGAQIADGATSKQGSLCSAGCASQRFTLRCTWLGPISC